MKGDTIKCQLFEVPLDFYMAKFTGFKLKSKVVSFDEYAKGRSNYEFLKDFNTLNLQSAYVTLITDQGDQCNVNKGFLGMEDLDDIED